MRLIAPLALLALLAACGEPGPPVPVTPGITSDTGARIEISGSASIGVAGSF